MSTTVLSGGRVIDPAARFDATADVVIVDGVITAVDADAGASVVADTTIDCTGLLVTPGLIDLHCHVFAGLGNFCVGPDQAGVERGVPTVVDGGTSGTATFDISRTAIIDHPSTHSRVLAFIDPNALYLATRDFICHKLEIANDVRNMDLDALASSLERHADVVVGCKVRACHVGDPEVSPFLESTKSVCDKPIMVHLGRFPHTPVITPKALLTSLRPGDIITHAFRGAGGMLDAGGKAVPEFRDAVDRGVRLDIGHSGTDFRFREARKLFDQGYVPDTISTDLNIFNIGGPVFHMAETMSKVMALGVDLQSVIAMATSNTARVLQRSDELGSLAVGRVGDVSVMRIVEGEVPLCDGHEPL
jgi:dihydroorotase